MSVKSFIEKNTGIRFDKVLSPHEQHLLELMTISIIAGTISGVIIRQIYVEYIARAETDIARLRHRPAIYGINLVPENAIALIPPEDCLSCGKTNAMSMSPLHTVRY